MNCLEFLRNKRCLLQLFFYLSTSVALINAIPMHVERWILKEVVGGQEVVIKTIDLISDQHMNIVQPSDRSIDIVQPEQGKLFTFSERMLATLLRKMNQFGAEAQGRPPISLVWEFDKKHLEESCTKADFISFMGCRFAKEFDPSKKQFISFVYSDDIREIDTDIRRAGQLINRYEHVPVLKPVLPRPVTNIYNYFLAVEAAIEELYVTTLKGRVPEEIDALVLKEIASFKDGLEELKSYIQKQNAQTILELFKKIRKKRETITFLKKWYQTVILSIANIEMLINVLPVDRPHVILFAGSGHCNYVANILKKMGFINTIDIGASFDDRKQTKKSIMNIIVDEKAMMFLLQPTNRMKPVIKKRLRAFDLEVIVNAINAKREKFFLTLLDEIKRLEQRTQTSLFNATIGSRRKTLLHRAAEKNWKTGMQKLLAIPNIIVDPIYDNYYTPLLLALKHGKVAIADMLLRKGASLDFSDYQKDKIMIDIIDGVRINSLKFLIDNGVIPVDWVSNSGYTLTHSAVARGVPRFIEAVIQEGAPTDTYEDNGFAPIHLVMLHENEQLIASLIQTLAKLNVDLHAKTKEEGSTVLHLAVLKEKLGIVKLLLDLGLSLDTKNNDGETPLDLAQGAFKDQLLQLREAENK